jgi:MYXO-CTERM domain-containing protein
MTKLWPVAALAASLCVPHVARAFGGFYVASGDAPMFNDATQVVLMRKGTRTVVSMQPTYKGPPDAFALVIPVPVALLPRDIRVLAPEVLTAVEHVGAPRLVEYWEQDPCKPDVEQGTAGKGAPDSLGVTVESQVAVGEYQIVILSAKDSTGLDLWLRREKYQIPAGTEALLQPYVDSGMKFVVAKIDPKKVRFENDRAVLSPLRFHYDSEQLTLPIRLGLANSSGVQDLIINILAPQQRYEVANVPNVTIPTNITVKNAVRDAFSAFYVALFDATLEKHPGAVITEYAGDAMLEPAQLQALGGDVLDDTDGFVLTRLHARYDKSIKNDLQFEPVPPKSFQARYAIRHPWNGPLTCANPVRGRWGADPGGEKLATDLGLVPRGSVELKSVVTHDIPELDLTLLEDPLALPPATAPATGPEKKKTGCGCGATDASGGLALAALLLLLRRKR